MSKVYFVPKKVASSIRTPVNLISINDPYGSWAEFSVKHNLLKLGFINDYSGIQEVTKRHLIQDEHIEKIIEFCKPIFEKGEDIIVHCGEGSVRSPAIANFISDLSGHFKCQLYMPSASYREHRGTDHHMCRYTYRTCVSYFAKKQTEGKTLITQDVVSDMAREAGVEWAALWNEIDYFRLPEGRRFIEEDVVKAIEKLKGSPAVPEVVVKDLGEIFGEPQPHPESHRLGGEVNRKIVLHSQPATINGKIPIVGQERIHPREPGGFISEATKDSSDPYSPEFQRALANERASTPRVVVTGMKDCSAGGCGNCKKDKQ